MKSGTISPDCETCYEVFLSKFELRLRFFKIYRVLSPQNQVLAKLFLGTCEFLRKQTCRFFAFYLRVIASTVVENKNSPPNKMERKTPLPNIVHV